MDPWNYEDYLNSVKDDMELSLKKRGYNAEQAWGFAHTELERRLDQYPDETPLALTALALCAIEKGVLQPPRDGSLFLADLKRNLTDDRLMSAGQKLVPDQRSRLLRDVERVKRALKLTSSD
jgi:hypothetical protein